MTETTKILLLDSNSLINRAFHALPPLLTNDGLYTNAIYGYMTMLYKLLSEEKPTHVCAVFDCRAKTFRHNMFDKYKATRKPMPEELAVQVPVLQQLLEKIGIKILFKEGFEADDILGTLSKRFNYPTIIVTGDRDALQLVDNSTTVFNTKKGITEVKKYTLDSLLEEGFTPDQIIDYKALAGDTSDNIPGCPGVGNKTAMDLLASYKSVDGIYEHIDLINGKLKDKLINNKDIIFLSQKLATIDTNVPIDCSINEITFEYKIDQNAREMMQYLQFKKLTDRFLSLSNDEKNISTSRSTETTEPFENTIGNFCKINCNTVKITNINNLNDMIANVENEKIIFLDFSENNYIIATNDTVFDIIISNDLLSEGLSACDAIDSIKKLLCAEYNKIFFDAKKSFHVLDKFGQDVCEPYNDVRLMAYLINNTKVIKTKEQLSIDYFFSSTNENAPMISLYQLLNKKIAEKNLEKLYNEIELPLIKVLFFMEKNGFKINSEILNELGSRYADEINCLLNEIYMLAGEIFNVNSNKQLATILFDKIGLKPSKKNKTGYSVDADTLEELNHPIVTAILRYRELTKLKSTYIDGMKTVMNPISGKVYTCFNQCITATGRLSSTEPNLQNIPIRKDEGREIRKMFVPSEGSKLVTADYSQIELRLLAHFSQEPKLIEAYSSNIDIHALTASKIFNVPIHLVTQQMRTSAKAVNFGIIYGISSFGLSKNAGVSQKQAKTFIEQYFTNYPSVKTYMEKNVELAKKQGYLTTLFGRIRYFPELTSPKHNIRLFGERAAMNMPLQGTASDIIKIAMLNVSRALATNNLKARIILQVHDELIVDTPINEIDKVKKILKQEMENAVRISVPLTVNISCGDNWYEAK